MYKVYWVLLVFFSVSILDLVNGSESFVCQSSFKERLAYLDKSIGMKYSGFLSKLSGPNLLPSSENSNDASINTLFKSLLSDEPTTLMFFGGSMLTGRNCREFNEKAHQCAYPNRIRKMLRFLFHQDLSGEDEGLYDHLLHVGKKDIVTNHSRNAVNILNMAQGGTTTGSTLPLLPLLVSKFAKPSAIFVDFSANDNDSSIKLEQLSREMEAMNRFFRSHLPEVPLFFVEVNPEQKYNKKNEMKEAVARHYDTPVISYRGVLSEEDKEGETYWQGPHGSFTIQKLIAYTVVKGLALGLEGKCRTSPSYPEGDLFPSLPPANWKKEEEVSDFLSPSYKNLATPLFLDEANQKKKISFCEPLTVIEASDFAHHPKHDLVHVTNGDWQLYEDRPGKPGWISEHKGSSLDMNVTFGENPRLIVGFLQSYEGIGHATVTFPYIPFQKSMILEGLHQSLTSQIFPIFLDVHSAGKPKVQSMGLGGGWLIKPNSKLSVRFVNMEDKKFKIEYVISC